MRVSIEWLKEYVDVTDSPENVADRLTFSGMEVEGIERFGPDLTGLVSAEVRAVARHPNADRLTLCRVFDGTRELQVVCGAPNVMEGGRYPLAPVGARLPDGTQIRSSKIRGIASEGMLCAEDELGLSTEHGGLMVLAPDTLPGTPLVDLFGKPDTVLDLEITPNRPDCLGLIGVAREVAALYGLPLRRPSSGLQPGASPVESLISVSVEDAERCPRYIARVLTDVRVAPSPGWMQRRLRAVGLRAIDNVVDITNYVQMETGHPLHAFDLDRVEGRRLTVRLARSGERLLLLDGVERELQPDMLVIADAARPMALAGILGGPGSGMEPGTRRVLLESACFHPSGIRRTARRLGLSTDSSYRFSRGTDPEAAEGASLRAAALLEQHAGACAANGRIDHYPAPKRPVTISCPWNRFARALGFETPVPEIIRTLESIELRAVRQDDQGADWSIPSFRLDLLQPVDLIEELARLRGLDRLPARPPGVKIVPGAEDRALRAVQDVRSKLVGLGLTEILNYSLVSETLLDRMDPVSSDRRVRLPNPLSMDQSVLRTALLPQMAETLGRNRSRQVEEAACFEIGRVFRTSPAGATEETTRVAIGLMGPVHQPVLERRAPPDALRRLQWIKGIVEALFRALNLPDGRLEAWDGAPYEAGCALAITIGGVSAGALGLLDFRRAAEWRIPDLVALAEFNLEPLLVSAGRNRPIQPPPMYPSSLRDLAFIVDKSVRHETLLSVIRRAAPEELERVELFDVYEGKGIEPGRKSVAYAFTWRAGNRTLTDAEVLGYDARVREALQKEFQAEVRDR
jgi:phenylalanyl-tRNA synthetase beta chain